MAFCGGAAPRYGMVPVMEGADFMYYDKDEYHAGDQLVRVI